MDLRSFFPLTGVEAPSLSFSFAGVPAGFTGSAGVEPASTGDVALDAGARDRVGDTSTGLCTCDPASGTGIRTDPIGGFDARMAGADGWRGRLGAGSTSALSPTLRVPSVRMVLLGWTPKTTPGVELPPVPSGVDPGRGYWSRTSPEGDDASPRLADLESGALGRDTRAGPGPPAPPGAPSLTIVFEANCRSRSRRLPPPPAGVWKKIPAGFPSGLWMTIPELALPPSWSAKYSKASLDMGEAELADGVVLSIRGGVRGPFGDRTSERGVADATAGGGGGIAVSDSV